MEPSSTMCRAQEGFHRERATNASLENAGGVAIKAAAAWAYEALAADRREARNERNRITAIHARHDLDEVDRASSENPDRGFADL